MVKKKNKQVLIVDNATTSAMRLKALIDVHGAEGRLLHWSDIDLIPKATSSKQVCLLVIEETVPTFVVEQVVESFASVPLFLLFSGDRIVNWNIEKAINPLSMSLSNYELMAMLEPYWVEEKAINLPEVLLLDSQSQSAYLCSKLLFSTNINSAVSDDVVDVHLNEFDMLLANISDNPNRIQQIVKAKRANPYLGVLLYGDEKDFCGFEFIQDANLVGIDDVIAVDKIDQELLPRFNRVWRKVAEFRDDQLVLTQNQHNMEQLLEQSLVLKVLFAGSIDGIVAFNSSGDIRRVNDSFSELLGYELEFMSTHNFYSCLNPASKQTLHDVLHGDYLQQQQVIDLKLVHKHRVEIPVSAAINRINFHGEYIFVAVTRNVSAQYLQEQILLKKNAQLEHQVKECKKNQDINDEMVRKGQRARSAFLAKMSRLAASNLSDTGEQWHKKLKNIDTMMRCEANSLALEQTQVDVRSIVDRVMNRFTEPAESQGVHFCLEEPEWLCVTKFDQTHLDMMLEEIIDNAIRYNLPRGEVRAYFEQIEGRLLLNICDTGVGVLDFKHQQIVDLYQANLADDDNLYTGLPLATALMEYNGGKIYCDNYISDNKVCGTRIILEFPF